MFTLLIEGVNFSYWDQKSYAASLQKKRIYPYQILCSDSFQKNQLHSKIRRKKENSTSKNKYEVVAFLDK